MIVYYDSLHYLGLGCIASRCPRTISTAVDKTLLEFRSLSGASRCLIVARVALSLRCVIAAPLLLCALQFGHAIVDGGHTWENEDSGRTLSGDAMLMILEQFSKAVYKNIGVYFGIFSFWVCWTIASNFILWLTDVLFIIGSIRAFPSDSLYDEKFYLHSQKERKSRHMIRVYENVSTWKLFREKKKDEKDNRPLHV